MVAVVAVAACPRAVSVIGELSELSILFNGGVTIAGGGGWVITELGGTPALLGRVERGVKDGTV